MLRTALTTAGLALAASLTFGSPAVAQTTHIVDLLATSFDPPQTDMQVGDSIDFVWIIGLHDVKSGLGMPDGAFDSGDPVNQPGKVFTVTFDQAFLDANPRPNNEYIFYCTIHIGFGMFGLANVDLPLEADTYEVSLATGGQQTLAFRPEASDLGNLYLLTGTTSGTFPGIPVDGVVVPINLDAYTLLVLKPNAILSPNFGVIGPNPQATVTIPTGTNPGLAGTTLHHAWVGLDPITLTATKASNAIPLTLVP